MLDDHWHKPWFLWKESCPSQSTMHNSDDFEWYRFNFRQSHLIFLSTSGGEGKAVSLIKPYWFLSFKSEWFHIISELANSNSWQSELSQLGLILLILDWWPFHVKFYFGIFVTIEDIYKWNLSCKSSFYCTVSSNKINCQITDCVFVLLFFQGSWKLNKIY